MHSFALFQAAFTILIGVLLFIIGALLNLQATFLLQHPDAIFLVLMGSGIILLLFGIRCHKRINSSFSPPGFLTRNTAIFSLGTLGVLYVSYILLTYPKDNWEFAMIWSYGEPAPEYPQTKHIILSFKDYPKYSIGIYSSDLGNYLENIKSKEVKVVFEVSLENDKVHSYKEKKIGDLSYWNIEWSYFEECKEISKKKKTCGPSPWERHKNSEQSS